MWSKVKKFAYQHRNKIYISLGVAALSYLGFHYLTKESGVKLSAFFKALKEGYIEEVIIEGKTIYFRSAEDKWFSTFLGSFPYDQIDNLIVSNKVAQSFRPNYLSKDIVTIGIETFAALATIYYLKQHAIDDPVKQGNFQPKVYDTNCSFKDFYGGELIKTKLRETISFIQDPQMFQQFGARIRRGILLYGPPGTGKTLLARALANQAHCQFIKVAASEFQQLFVGVGARRVRELFASAKKCPNGCIIFIDQIDALGSRINFLKDNSETTSTITQFLSELDGFKPLDKIVVVASTNRIDLVDAAVLRAGRFDIKVQVSLPEKEQRLGIFKTLVNKKLKHHDLNKEDMEGICDRLEGCSGADIEALLNQSVFRAIRQGSRVVKETHVSDSLEDMMLQRY